MSGWISGFVELPPGAIKDAEGVGECAQVFFITESQDDALEVGIADPSDEGMANSQISASLTLSIHTSNYMYYFPHLDALPIDENPVQSGTITLLSG